jgi:hypothetical protein
MLLGIRLLLLPFVPRESSIYMPQQITHEPSDPVRTVGLTISTSRRCRVYLLA